MSKKIASGAKKLVIDIKVGNGALIKTKRDATKLAKLMITIGKKYNIKVVCLLTNMDIPLGSNIGNALEVKEVIDILKNKKQGNLRDLCIELASNMVSLGLEIPIEEAKNKVINNLNNGSAYNKFLEFVKYQGGNIDKLPESKYTFKIKSNKDGYLTKLDALEIGKLSMHLGAGREKIDDTLDYGAGIIIHKNINDKVKKRDVIMTLYTSRDLYIKDIQKEVFTISNEQRKDIDLIYKIIKGE